LAFSVITLKQFPFPSSSNPSSVQPDDPSVVDPTVDDPRVDDPTLDTPWRAVREGSDYGWWGPCWRASGDGFIDRQRGTKDLALDERGPPEWLK